MFDDFGYPTLEMRCPSCKACQQIKLKNNEPRLTRCLPCKTLLVVEIDIVQKPNNIKFSLIVTPVPLTVSGETKNIHSIDKLKAVTHVSSHSENNPGNASEISLSI